MIHPRSSPGLLRWCALLLLAGAAAAAPLPRKVVSASGSVNKAGNNYDIPSSLGTRVGGNLFHTFVQFDLSEGEIATFGGPAGISNVLARVTGSRSFIDGTIRSTIPNAKLFLMNARGVTFEEHAHLDISGAFTVTTADVIKLQDGGHFDALDPTKDSLTAGPISAYGFLGQQSSSVVANAGTKLTGAAGQTLSIVAGKIFLNGGDTVESAVALQAPQGRLELASVTKGDLKMSLGPGPALGQIVMSNAQLGAESAAIHAGDFSASQTTALTTGALDVRVRGTANFDNGTRLIAQTDGTKPSANFSIRGGVVKLTGASEIGTAAPLGATAGSKAGRVSVVAGKLILQNSSKVWSTTSGAGAAGDVSVRAQQISVVGGADAIEVTGIFSRSLQGGTDPNGHPFPAATGASGSTDVRADSLSLRAGGAIGSDTFSVGHGGNVTVQARDILIADSAGDRRTGIFSDTAAGNGGNVRISADTLKIRSGGLISTKTIGNGNAGNVVVAARELTIDASHAPLVTFTTGTSVGSGGGVIGPTQNGHLGPAFTGIAVDSASAESTLLPAHAGGAGGDVHVQAELVRITGGGQISATTATKGKGGSVFVDSREIILEGRRADVASSISAESLAQAGAGGASGSVVVNANDLSISSGARISATTFGAGQAGGVNVTARSAEITSKISDPFTGILAISASPTLPGVGGSVRADFETLEITGGGAIAGNTLGPGRGGDVIVRTGATQLLQGGRISADTSGLGAGGSIDFTSADLLISGATGLRSSGIFSGSSAIGIGGPAGSVRVAAESARLLKGGTIAATSTSSGIGGSVAVMATNLLLDRASSIAASATGLGIAGSVDLQVEEPLIMRGASSVRTTSAISDAGTVSITSATSILMEGNSSITVQATLGNAGRIALVARHLLSMQNSQLVAEAGMNGGDIFVDPEFIVLDHSRISANAVMTGGNILLTAQNFLPSETPVTATGSTAGTVQISAPQLDLSGALAALSAQLVDASIRFQERCAMRLGGEVSTFLVLGRGGVEDFPGNPPLVLSRPTAPAPARAR